MMHLGVVRWIVTTMRLVQFREHNGHRAVALVAAQSAVRLDEVETVYELALEAMETGQPLADVAQSHAGRSAVDLAEVARAGRLLAPLEHPVPTRCWITGTGLTHLGSAEARERMFAKASAPDSELSDAMKLWKWGSERGKPARGETGVQPEWFFRGNGSSLVGSEQPLPLPHFALDGGEEPELVGLYVIGDDGTPCRLGWTLGNDFTDHRMEKQNYLYLAHSKLRTSAMGPELLLGEMPASIEGVSRIVRAGQTVWEKPFFAGTDHMIHSVANLEYHHFKYPMFRRPGDVHLHFFGTSVVSAADGFQAEPGDLFEISAPALGLLPLRNTLEPVSTPVPAVRVL
jgi:hypothetical protein